MNETATPPTGGQKEDPGPSARPRSPWDVLVIAVILAALIGLTVYVVHHYSTSTDAATILGIVVPAVATIGAAVFGVRVAYQAGSAKGQSQGAATAKKEVASRLLDPVTKALEAVANTHDSITTAGASAPGSSDVVFRALAEADAPAGTQESRGRVQISPQPLDDAKRQLEFVRGALTDLAG